jgi:hypothetical protein
MCPEMRLVRKELRPESPKRVHLREACLNEILTLVVENYVRDGDDSKEGAHI